MIEDLEVVNQKIAEYVKIIMDEYGNWVRDDLNNNDLLVKFNDTNTISFFVIKNILYLPKFSYKIFPELKKLSNNNVKRKGSYHNYLDTNTTYYDYINHVIQEGLTPLDYFLENLLHEAMHMCGSCGKTPLEEGINELKTRELAQKRGLLTSGMGYPKETAIAKEMQAMIGKHIMDELTFIPRDQRYCFLKEKRGLDMAVLYQNVSKSMEKSYMDFFRKIQTIENPFSKAEVYEKIDYSEAITLIDNNKPKDKVKVGM